MGTLLLALGMSISGIAFAFVKGWSYSLVLLAAGPVLAIGISFSAKVMQTGFVSNTKAYG